MSDKKRSAKGKWKNALLAAALTASVILALPAWSVGHAEATETGSTATKRFDENRTSTLTIRRAGENPAKQGTITVDLYKVAAAVKEPNYDGYTLAVPDGDEFYTSVVKEAVLNANVRDANLTEEKRMQYNEAYRQLAQTVAEEVLALPEDSTVSDIDVAGKENGKFVATKDITGSGSITFDEALEPGMYLIIAHGKDLTPAEYIGITADDKLVTMAYNNGYVYNYLPELIALPMRGTSANAPQGAFSTAQSEGDWQYEVTAELKAEEAVERVPLQITKTFSGAENALLTGKNGCVFRIEAMLNGQKVYSNVVAAEFEKGQTPVVLTTEAVIPVGATVTVTEEYDGAAFKGEGDEDDESVTKSGTDITYNETSKRYEVSFTNTYNEINTGGDIVTNSFTKDAEGYHWNDPRSAQGNVTENND